MVSIATEDAVIKHYGSTIVGPVTSTPDLNVPNFVTIETKIVLSTEDTVDTPSHEYDPTPLFHSHLNQVIDIQAQSFVKIEGNPVLVQNDKNSVNDTRIDDAGQSFVVIS